MKFDNEQTGYVNLNQFEKVIFI